MSDISPFWPVARKTLLTKARPGNIEMSQFLLTHFSRVCVTRVPFAKLQQCALRTVAQGQGAKRDQECTAHHRVHCGRCQLLGNAMRLRGDRGLQELGDHCRIVAHSDTRNLSQRSGIALQRGLDALRRKSPTLILLLLLSPRDQSRACPLYYI